MRVRITLEFETSEDSLDVVREHWVEGLIGVPDLSEERGDIVRFEVVPT
jgi:hypothetical protein